MESRWGKDLVGEKRCGEKRYREKEEIKFPEFSLFLPGDFVSRKAFCLLFSLFGVSNGRVVIYNTCGSPRTGIGPGSRFETTLVQHSQGWNKQISATEQGLKHTARHTQLGSSQQVKVRIRWMYTGGIKGLVKLPETRGIPSYLNTHPVTGLGNWGVLRIALSPAAGHVRRCRDPD